jgi:DNA-binding PadR family transcriptional regulator
VPAPRLSPAATLVLDTLREGTAHPYEMLATLRRRRDDRLVRLTPGAVYHAVDRLERDGLVERVGVEREGNRPERTTYALTTAGTAALTARTRELVRDTPPEHAGFPVGLALVHELAQDDAADLLRERRDALTETIEGVREELDDLVSRGLPRRYLLDAFFQVDRTSAEIAWIDTVLAELASGALSWTDEPAAPFRTSRPHSTQEKP